MLVTSSKETLIEKSEFIKDVKQRLFIKQKKDKVFLTGSLSSCFLVEGLVLIARKSKQRTVLTNQDYSSNFQFELSFSELSYNNEYVDFYIKVAFNNEVHLLEPMDHLVDGDALRQDLETDRYLLRVGEFKETYLEGVHPYKVGSTDMQIYITKNNNFSISINKKITNKPEVFVEQITLNKKTFQITGVLYSRNYSVKNTSVNLLSRVKNEKVAIHTNFQWDQHQEYGYGLKKYRFQCEINNTTLDVQKLFDDTYDVYLALILEGQDEELTIRLKRPNIDDFLSQSFICSNKQNAFIIQPHATHGRNNLSFIVTSFDNKLYFYLRIFLACNPLLRFLYSWKKIWIVGELPYKAQDTGYHFFKYMREKHPNRRVYYVMDWTSKEYKNVNKYGNILPFKSTKHILYTLVATRIIGSHHPDYIYPLRSEEFKSKVKGKKVFLQHGVMGTRNSTHFYGSGSIAFETDLFIVSSDFEKQMIINDFGYDPSVVKVTGLSRFDRLFDKKSQLKRQILIIPTWREWLTREDKFLASEYFDRYNKLLHHEHLLNIAKQNNIELVFCLHPNMQQYSQYFKSENIRIISQGEVNVQDLLKESAMMLTDYSSVAFDFSFLNKPVLYYQFDREKFIGEKGSHLDLDQDLPGPIAKTEEKLVKLIERYIENGLTMKRKYKLRADKFIKYKDQKSCRRIYLAIREPRLKDVIKSRLMKLWKQLTSIFN